MELKIKQRIKLLIILGVEFIAIATILLLIFFAGKQSYTVTFDLNGGTLISGDTEQRVTQGHHATPPTATKEGHYFLMWSGSYREVTHDTVVVAIWEYETSPGIEYNVDEGKNYCTISGCFKDVQGEVYIGAYYDGKKVLGIEENAFKDCTGITAIHLLDGILTIEDGAFAGCTNLTSIELPSTVVSMGNEVFKGCEKLEEIALPASLQSLGDSAFEECYSLASVTLPEGLNSIGADVFKGCDALKEVILPESVETIGANAFTNTELIVYTYVKEEERPDGWAADCFGDGVQVVWNYAEQQENGANDANSQE